jgi:hypothetical protein
VRVLLDKNVPYPIKRTLSSCTVTTVEQEGWGTLSNGLLLQAAEQRFEVLVTCDQNIIHQQNLSHRRLAVVVIDTNLWPVIRVDPDKIRRAVETSLPGSYQVVHYPKPNLRRRPYRPPG